MVLVVRILALVVEIQPGDTGGFAGCNIPIRLLLLKNNDEGVNEKGTMVRKCRRL